MGNPTSVHCHLQKDFSFVVCHLSRLLVVSLCEYICIFVCVSESLCWPSHCNFMSLMTNPHTQQRGFCVCLCVRFCVCGRLCRLASIRDGIAEETAGMRMRFFIMSAPNVKMDFRTCLLTMWRHPPLKDNAPESLFLVCVCFTCNYS